MWSRDKIEQKRNYFHQQRLNPTGNFTEYITRVYFNILKYANNENNICYYSDLDLKQVIADMYKGIYDKPDHEGRRILKNCINELINMGYIHEDVFNDKKCFVIDKELDYLLENENDYYVKRYKINQNVNRKDGNILFRMFENSNEFNVLLAHMYDPQNNAYEHDFIDFFKCHQCNGKYVLKKGMYGYFFGCNQFPKCKSSRSLADITYDILQENGLAVYELETKCWKCNETIKMISYFPYIDFCNIDSDFEKIDYLKAIRLSVLQNVDKKIQKEFPNINENYSKKAGFSYIANTCMHCGALQGSSIALSNMFEELYIAYKQNNVNQFIVKRIVVNEEILPKNEWGTLIESIKSECEKYSG